MRIAIIVLAAMLFGCSKQDGSVNVPLSPGAITPRDMTPREWATYVAQSGIQADRRAKTFTPAWTGFSAAPAGDLDYFDFGSIVFVSWDGPAELVGTSNTFRMTITNLPEAIRPNAPRWVKCLVVNNDFTTEGSVLIGTDGSMEFYFHQVGVVTGALEGLTPHADSFNNANSKGVPAGWLIAFVK